MLGEAGRHLAVELMSSGQGSACRGTCPLGDPLRSPGSGTGLTQPCPDTSTAPAVPREASFPTGHAQVSPLDRHGASAVYGPTSPRRLERPWPASLPCGPTELRCPLLPACPGSAPAGQGAKRLRPSLPALQVSTPTGSAHRG